MAISSADWQIFEQEDDLVFYVDIENLGEAESKETKVRIWDSKHGGFEGSDSVPALAPDDTTTAEIRLEIPEDLWGTTRTFIVEVYPIAGEADEENNVARLPGIFIRKMKVLPEEPWKDVLPNEEIWVVLVATVALGALGGISLRRRRVRIRLRKEWQVKAEEGEPPEECQPCNHYCQKKPELEPSLRKITDLDLVAYDPISGERIGKMQLESEIVDGLNEAVDAYRLRRDREKLREMVVPLSQVLLQHIGGWLQGESLHDVSIVGRLKGYKVSCQFILWHCEKVNEWVRKEEWKAVIEQKGDKSVGTLHSFDPAEPDMLEPELTQLLIQFIENA
ncbi:MAG: CARDB domain-containing protein [Euryarchaeota archaeon]|nr:CARDB domain-containing protein [Euryarchaeota archaeon]